MNDVTRDADLLHNSAGAVTVPPPDALAHAQSVLAAIVAKEFTRVEEQFTAEMKAALPSGRLAAMWTGLQTQAGAFKGCGRSRGS